MKKNIDPSGELPPIWTDATDHQRTEDGSGEESGRDHEEES